MSGIKDHYLGDDLFSCRPARLQARIPDGIPEDVALKFEELALDLIRAGRRHYSSDAILHRLRWYFDIERGDADFKCNDHWTAPLARWFLARHPEHEGFFELRKLRSERQAA